MRQRRQNYRKPHLNKFNLPKTILLNPQLTAIEVKIDSVWIPYVKGKKGPNLPKGLQVASVLRNVYMKVSSCIRSVKWESDTIFEVKQGREIRPVLVDNWTLERLAVLVVFEKQSKRYNSFVGVNSPKQAGDGKTSCINRECRSSGRAGGARGAIEGEEFLNKKGRKTLIDLF